MTKSPRNPEDHLAFCQTRLQTLQDGKQQDKRDLFESLANEEKTRIEKESQPKAPALTINKGSFKLRDCDSNAGEIYLKDDEPSVSLADEWSKFGPVKSAFLQPKSIGRVGTMGFHPLIDCIFLAHSRQLPFRIDPACLWWVIVQTAATFLDRTKLPVGLASSGKVEFSDLVDVVSAQVPKDLADLANASFSTTSFPFVLALFPTVGTSSAKRTARGLTGGITRVELLGTADDWKLLAKKIGELQKMKGIPADWAGELSELGKEFVACWADDVNADFWGSIWHAGGSRSTAAYMSGWLSLLFPNCPTAQFAAARRRAGDRYGQKALLQLEDSGVVAQSLWKPFPSAVVSVQFDGGSTQVIGGLCGTFQDYGTKVLDTRLGWAVCGKAVPVKPQSDPLPANWLVWPATFS